MAPSCKCYLVTEQSKLRFTNVGSISLHVSNKVEKCLTLKRTMLTGPYMPTQKLRFQEQKSPKSRTQYNFPEHISKCIPTFMK